MDLGVNLGRQESNQEIKQVNTKTCWNRCETTKDQREIVVAGVDDREDRSSTERVPLGCPASISVSFDLKFALIAPSKLPRLSSPAGGSSSNSQSFLAPAARLMMRGGDLSVVAKKGRGCSEVEEGEAESPLVLEEWIKDIDKKHGKKLGCNVLSRGTCRCKACSAILRRDMESKDLSKEKSKVDKSYIWGGNCFTNRTG
ncbi:hypothetical protein NC653_018757 [Populus alba x Populus x berolinensis]|uniref:Uncharacterized protein n=1 Tax=Populus alba x Populus x berolinensis TaxID=444605 RepID=A0AAD6QH78_9ROSI|nr:hypothetical protein NC653_018757 [Populus alba x Populus x berolinensis]